MMRPWFMKFLMLAVLIIAVIGVGIACGDDADTASPTPAPTIEAISLDEFIEDLENDEIVRIETDTKSTTFTSYYKRGNPRDPERITRTPNTTSPRLTVFELLRQEEVNFYPPDGVAVVVRDPRPAYVKTPERLPITTLLAKIKPGKVLFVEIRESADLLCAYYQNDARPECAQKESDITGVELLKLFGVPLGPPPDGVDVIVQKGSSVVFGSAPAPTQSRKIALSQVLDDARANKVLLFDLDIPKKNAVTVYYAGKTDTPFLTFIQDGTNFLDLLRNEGIDTRDGLPYVRTTETKTSKAFGGFPLLIIPIAVLGFLVLFLLRSRLGGGAGNLLNQFGKSKARQFSPKDQHVTFNDVAGVDEAKEELQEIVDFLKEPERFTSVGARIPQGVLLVGPPGTGKTLLAKAVAGEADVPFFSMAGSEFIEMFVGVGASRVRDLFDNAKKNAPCILFIDEIEVIGQTRTTGPGGHQEYNQTLGQILTEMSGFDTSTHVIVLAATNRPDMMDAAILRSGRFDRKIIVDLPDIKGRIAILGIHTKGRPLDKDVNLEAIAKQTPGFSGADLANLMNEAAILAGRRRKPKITMAECDEAVDRVIAGPERKSRIMSENERKIIAYHEAGHALLGHLLRPHTDPPYRISIIARGMAGGFTRFAQEEERRLRTQEQIEAFICAALGGLAAEELCLGQHTTGPQDDLERATNYAELMVEQLGMSGLGLRAFRRAPSAISGTWRTYSDKINQEIDDAVRAIITSQHEKAKQILSEHRPKLDHIVSELLQKETIEGEALTMLFNASVGEEPVPAEETPQEEIPEPTIVNRVTAAPVEAIKGGGKVVQAAGYTVLDLVIMLVRYVRKVLGRKKNANNDKKPR